MPFAEGAKATPTYFRARSGALADFSMEHKLFYPEIYGEGFGKDPFGYSAKAYIQWNMLKAMHEDGDFDPYASLQDDELKNPVLWLTQAEALTQAALSVHVRSAGSNY